MAVEAKYGELRAKFMAYLKEHPGATNEELAVAINRTVAQTGVYASGYRTAELIVTRKIFDPARGRSIAHHFLPGTAPADIPQKLATRMPSEVTRTVFVHEKPKQPVADQTTTVREEPQVVTSAEPYKEPSPFADALQSTMTTLATTLAAELMAQLQPMIVAKLGTMVQSAATEPGQRPMPKAPEPPVAAKKKLRSVCIIGLWASQAGHIVNEFSECLDLRFVTADEHERQLVHTAKDADFVVLIAGKVSHKHSEALHTVRRDEVVLHGGLTQLRDRLTEIYLKEQS